jgi:transcriptional regulator PpsR
LPQPFQSPGKSLAGFDTDSASRIITAAADLALVLDGRGVIRDLSIGSDELSKDNYADWLGRSWIETVTPDSRPKVEALLAAARSRAAPAWRQVNHPSPRGGDLPVLYSAVQVGKAGNVVALGRNLRSVAALQQRLIDAQQSLERDFERLRQAETRYRLLFELAAEAVLILDAASQKVVDANPAAGRLLGQGVRLMIGRTFPDGFDEASSRSIQDLLGAIRVNGRGHEIGAQLASGGQRFRVSASPFRQDNASHILVRLVPLAGNEAVDAAGARSRLAATLERLPDSFVLTDPAGLVLAANRAFLDLVQLSAEEQVCGESIERWLGRPGVDLNVLIANLREHDAIRLFATTIRGEYGAVSEVEISAVSAPDADPPCLAFSLRSVARRLPDPSATSRELPKTVQQLTQLIGRVPLKDLVRETTDVIERLCIEAALELTGDNRASAAELLGLSRQSLYVKLRRFGIDEASAAEETGEGEAE